jgi:hypothetical protein
MGSLFERMRAQRRDVLSELRSQLLALSVHARDGAALISLGEAVHAVETVLQGGQIDRRIEVEIGFRFGGEGMYACVDLDDEGVHFSTISSGETANYGLDWWDFSRWRGTVDEIISLGGGLTVSINR